MFKKIIYSAMAFAIMCSSVFGGHRVVKVRNNNAINQVIIKDKIVEFDTFYPQQIIHTPVSNFNLDYYYSLRQELQVDEIAEKVVEKLKREGYCVKQGEGGDDGYEPKPEPKPDNPPGEEPTALDNKVFDIFERRCAQCHEGENSPNGLQLVSGNNLIWQSLENRVEIHRRTFGQHLNDGEQRMPPNGPALTQVEIDTLLEWVYATKGK